ncbi:hypothetical protein LINGRAPRIM_LOCUS69 [Linum grandiflorum]
MIDKAGREFEKALKTRRWSVLGRDGSRVLLELDEYGMPIGEEGYFLRQVNGKIVKTGQLDIGAKKLAENHQNTKRSRVRQSHPAKTSTHLCVS